MTHPDPDTRESEQFKREERYIVLKRKHINPLDEASLRSHLVAIGVPTIECVVVESDWPEYEVVWGIIEARVAGRTPVSEPSEAMDDDLQRALKSALRFAASRSAITAAQEEAILKAALSAAPAQSERAMAEASDKVQSACVAYRAARNDKRTHREAMRAALQAALSAAPKPDTAGLVEALTKARAHIGQAHLAEKLGDTALKAICDAADNIEVAVNIALEAFSQHEPSEPTDYAQGVEDAAKVAEEMYQGHGHTFSTPRSRSYEHAARRITAAIRNLKKDESDDQS